ncbi:hypothetical protein DFH08DRAFT_946192 [Mycena albidolilacea]|uniref:Rho-GAP domain-containing protein n=1 Tax=Mycena albidolilacea TaxID=1033008 RepID=A0AAD7E6L9_9AGAR|nr:hypothetical protein DFH08DRAFT_946192 [Mycena albidolilacea]
MKEDYVGDLTDREVNLGIISMVTPAPGAGLVELHIGPASNRFTRELARVNSVTTLAESRISRRASPSEGKLWKDLAPAKVDQCTAILETYLQALVNLPVKNNNEPVMQAGHKEGYLTKRGKNFGGWKTHFFVLQGPVLEYYCDGGAHLGSITVAGAQIGRQQRTMQTLKRDAGMEPQDAFARVAPDAGGTRKGSPPSSFDPDRMSVNDQKTRTSVCGPTFLLPVDLNFRAYRKTPSELVVADDMFLREKNADKLPTRRAYDSPEHEEKVLPVALKDAVDADASPTTKPARDRLSNGQMTGGASLRTLRTPRPPKNGSNGGKLPCATRSIFGKLNISMLNSSRRSIVEDAPNTASVLFGTTAFSPFIAVARHPTIILHTDTSDAESVSVKRSGAPSGTTTLSFEKTDSKVKISGPIGGTPIPAGYKLGDKDTFALDASAAAAANDRREKAKSRSFLGGFGRSGGNNKAEKSHTPVITFIPRAVFEVTLDESLDVAQIANLPVIVFRCIQSAVIKNLKHRFNMKRDIDLVGSDEYWDPHAIAGLLKSFLREQPASILTHNLHLCFLSIIVKMHNIARNYVVITSY